MSESIVDALDKARRDRKRGRVEEAERGYRGAAGLARSANDPVTLAHALRHVSDLARQRGARSEAFELASEAVDLYRRGDDLLGLANALRLKALSAPGKDQAVACWQEARDLYESAAVPAGVAECDSQLGRRPE
jgi:tetratricopeptide (TPR) repeat protein